jgi:hypothetical protein
VQDNQLSYIDCELGYNDRMWNKIMDFIINQCPEREAWRYAEICRNLTLRRNELLNIKRGQNVVQA